MFETVVDSKNVETMPHCGQPLCKLEVEEMLVIADFILCSCWDCYQAEVNEVHVYDLLTQRWRDDVELPRAGCPYGSPLFTMRRHRFHAFSEDVLAFAITSDFISIQGIVERSFQLLYVIDVSVLYCNFDDCLNVDGVFFALDTPRTIFFYGDSMGRECLMEVTVDEPCEKDGIMFASSSSRRLHLWYPPDIYSHVGGAFRYKNKIYIIRIGDVQQRMNVFDCGSRELLEYPLKTTEYLKTITPVDLHPSLLMYEFSNVWLTESSILLPNVQLLNQDGNCDEWWCLQFEKNSQGVEEPMWHLFNPLLEPPLQCSDQGCRAPNGDVFFMRNETGSLYRIPARFWGKVKTLEQLAKDALMNAAARDEKLNLEEVKTPLNLAFRLIDELYTSPKATEETPKSESELTMID